jgi:hypothetical protein
MFKHSFLIILALVSGLVNAGSELENLAGTLQPGQWGKLNTTEGTEVIFKPNGGDIFEYSNRAAWDPYHKVLYFCGSSHHGSFYNDCVRYDSESNSWASIGVPPGVCKDNCASGGSVVNFGHGYDHNAFDSKRGVFYIRISRILYRYNTLTASWSQTPPMPESCLTTGGAEILEYFPDIDRLVFLSSWCTESGSAYFDPNTDTWSLPQAALPNGGYHLQGAYTNDGYVYGGGGNETIGMARVDKDGVWQQIADCPVACLDVYSLLVGDPTSAHLLLFELNGNIWEFDARAGSANGKLGSWTNTGITGNFPTGQNPIIAPITNYGVIMMPKTVYGGKVEVWLYKHKPFSDVTPPSVTISSPTNGSTLLIRQIVAQDGA